MADYLALALDGAPRDLFSPDEMARLNALGKKLPPGFGDFLFGFECRLGEGDPAVDLAMGTPQYNLCRDLIKGILEHHLFNVHARVNSVWEKLKTLIEGYLGNDPALSKCLENIILEFDRETAGDDHPVPGVFLGLRPYSRLAGNQLGDNATRRPVPRVTPGAAYRAMVRGLEIIGGNRLPGETRKTFRRIYRQLTPPAIILYAGAMLSRHTTAVRICTRHIDGTDIISFLKSTGWKGDYKTLAHVTGVWGDIFNHFILNIDVAADILPKVGVECYFHQKKQPNQEKRWKKLVEQLIAEGICAAGKGEGLLSFTARKHFFPTPVFEDDPNSPTRLPRHPLVMTRGLHHLKFIIEPEKPLSVKAYLWAGVKQLN